MLYTLGIHGRTKQEETKAKISALLELTFQCRRTACVTDNTIVLWERRWGGKGWSRVGAGAGTSVRWGGIWGLSEA